MRIINRINRFILKLQIILESKARVARIGFGTKIMEKVTIDKTSQIGKYTYIGSYTMITKSEIGNYCSIASSVKIGQGEHDIKKVSTSSLFYHNKYEELTKGDCIIGNDVWIGANAIVLRGVTIGNGAVVGGGAVVTNDVPPFAIVVGSPARILKYRFDKKKIKNITDSNWWNYDFDLANKIIEKMNI